MPFYAIISGAGSGTGASVARLFAKKYPVVLLARTAASYEPIIADITASGGKAIGIASDATDPAAVNAVFEQIAKELPGHQLAAAVYNPAAGMKYLPFLEQQLETLDASLATNVRGLFLFAQKTIPLLLEAVDAKPAYPPSLIVTGATGSVRGSAKFSTFATGKFGQRGLTQSLSREFGPRGVHVAYVIVDGGIDTPWGKERVVNNGVEDGKISPDAIAESYWHLHTQHRSAFTQELDLRPFVEKF